MKTMVSTAGGVSGAPSRRPTCSSPGAKAGPWIVERELGRGGMGAVYAVVHEEIGKRAALKVVHRRLLTPGVQRRAHAARGPGRQRGRPPQHRRHLRDRQARRWPPVHRDGAARRPAAQRTAPTTARSCPDQVIAILLQVCDALIAAHAASVVHRDLKLDNVFLVDNPDDPGTPKVKLLDWGIAKVINRRRPPHDRGPARRHAAVPRRPSRRAAPRSRRRPTSTRSA